VHEHMHEIYLRILMNICLNEYMMKCILFIFVYWMHDAYIKSIFYWMNNNMEMNSIVLIFFLMRFWKCMNDSG